MKPPTTNKQIAQALREMAAFYEMEGIPYKPAAYERVADTLEVTDLDAKELYEKEGVKGLRRIEGVGEGLADHIKSLLNKGMFPEYRKFKKKYPIDVLGLTSIEHVGPKTAKTLFKELKVKNVKDLEKAARAGRVHGIAGFGVKAEEKIIKGIGIAKQRQGRELLGNVLPLARKIEESLRNVPGVDRAFVAGSVRRRQETIGDLDFIVTSSDAEKVMEAFAALPQVHEVLGRGGSMGTVRLKNGMHADVLIVEDDAFGAVLQHFTGDKEHNIALRKIAIKKGLMLNEHGLFRGKKRLASRTEEDVYKMLGLEWMEPEIRTASGEIEAAMSGKLPKLISYDAIRGDLQVQTEWTDGAESIGAMAEEAKRLGFEYIAVTDHTRTLAMTGGLDEKKLARQGREIDALNAKFSRTRDRFRILKGSEVNIMKDGSLDIDDAALGKLDLVGASIHSHFDLSRKEQTARLIAAMKNPNVDVIFHPTGRKINERKPIDIDIDAVLRAAKETGTAMEINSEADRMDLRDAHVRHAVALGVKLVINTDAHYLANFGSMELGIAIARRGWATKADVLNTRKLPELLTWLKKPKSQRK